MPIPEDAKAAAVEMQRVAAMDGSRAVRLVAGPGTGKSSAIEQRVRWLLESGTAPEAIYAISFTRASAADLRDRIESYCGLADLDTAGLNVSTLHALALRLLRRAGLLARYPAGPSVLDEWELANIFTREFADATGIPPTRANLVRRHHEAFWSTGLWDPPNYVPPTPPISGEERERFDRFHRPTTEAYACVLPGEIVRECVEQIEAGHINPLELMELAQLIVDEYQDLNPFDLRFVDALSETGIPTFVAGDDDQSIYSFRFASPRGIQEFVDARSGAGDHALEGCFRSTASITNAANGLISRHSTAERIPKTLRSLYETADPPVNGVVLGQRFASERQEAAALATSCGRLVESGIPPRQILILLANSRLQAPLIEAALDRRGIEYEMPKTERFIDTRSGRATFAVLRIVCDPDDYVAHRTLISLQDRVGVRTARLVKEHVIRENWNYRDLFYGLVPLTALNARQRTAIERVERLVADLVDWEQDDPLSARLADLPTVLEGIIGADDAATAADQLAEVDGEFTIREARELLGADQEEQRARVLLRAYQRLGKELGEAEILPNRVRVMTMHGAKGLGAQVVFIPGLEEQLLPGEHRRPYPGLVFEAARLLYVSVTRARAAAVLSYSRRRAVYGRLENHAASQYLTSLGVPFANAVTGISEREAELIAAQAALL